MKLLDKCGFIETDSDKIGYAAVRIFTKTVHFIDFLFFNLSKSLPLLSSNY